MTARKADSPNVIREALHWMDEQASRVPNGTVPLSPENWRKVDAALDSLVAERDQAQNNEAEATFTIQELRAERDQLREDLLLERENRRADNLDLLDSGDTARAAFAEKAKEAAGYRAALEGMQEHIQTWPHAPHRRVMQALIDQALNGSMANSQEDTENHHSAG